MDAESVRPSLGTYFAIVEGSKTTGIVDQNIQTPRVLAQDALSKALDARQIGEVEGDDVHLW